jgi:hypothetical protein
MDIPAPVPTVPDGQPCKWCGTPLSFVGRRRRTNRKFCNTGCRNNWHLSRRKLALEQMRTAGAMLAGAIKLLDGDDM